MRNKIKLRIARFFLVVDFCLFVASLVGACHTIYMKDYVGILVYALLLAQSIANIVILKTLLEWYDIDDATTAHKRRHNETNSRGRYSRIP